VKQYFKPSKSKIIFFALFCLIFLYILPAPIFKYQQYISDDMFYSSATFLLDVKGYPFNYHWVLPIPMFPAPSPSYFSYPYLIIDILFGYFISCLIVWFYSRLKEKSPHIN